MAMTRRANNNARVSKRKGSRKGSKRVSRKGKKSSRKGTKKRGMLARLMGKMRRGKKSSRKSKGKKNNNVAVLVPAKGGQRGGGAATKLEDKTADVKGLSDDKFDGLATKTAVVGAKKVLVSDGSELVKTDRPNGTVEYLGKTHNVFMYDKNGLKGKKTELNITDADVDGHFATAP
jgi:hypothetical protein